MLTKTAFKLGSVSALYPVVYKETQNIYCMCPKAQEIYSSMRKRSETI